MFWTRRLTALGTRVRVFASVAAGEDQPGSDVDVLFVSRHEER